MPDQRDPCTSGLYEEHCISIGCAKVGRPADRGPEIRQERPDELGEPAVRCKTLTQADGPAGYRVGHIRGIFFDVAGMYERLEHPDDRRFVQAGFLTHITDLGASQLADSGQHCESAFERAHGFEGRLAASSRHDMCFHHDLPSCYI